MSDGVALRVARTLRELQREFGGDLDDGVAPRTVDRVVSPEHAASDADLVVVTAARLTSLASSVPGVLLCQQDLAPRVPGGRRWVHAHAPWVVARLLAEVSTDVVAPGIEPTASVNAEAHVHPTASVRQGAVVLGGATIGRETLVGEGAVVYGRTCIGARVTIGPNAVLGRPGFGWAASPDGTLIRVPQLGGVIVEDDVEIGALATVDAGTLSPTILRRGVKLDAHVHVAHNVEIGAHTVVAAQAGFAGSAWVGKGVLVGGQAGVTDHARVGEGARIAAKSGVIGDIAPGKTVAGFPAIPRVEWLRAWAGLLGQRKRTKT